MGLSSLFANAVDKVGTALHLPELGLSERIAGGATANTGNKTLFGSPDLFPSPVYSGSGSLPGIGYNSSNRAVPQPGAPAPKGQENPLSNTLFNQPITVAPTSTGGAGSGAPTFQPVVYNGQQYNDQGSYNAAILKDAQTSHDQAVKDTEKAYKDGLITFDQRRQALDLSRGQLSNQISSLAFQDKSARDQVNQGLTSALQNNAGFFASVSPDAYQSYQGTLENKAKDAAAQGIAGIDQNKASNDLAIQGAQQGIDQAQTGLDQSQAGFANQFVNSVGAQGAQGLAGGDQYLGAALQNNPNAVGSLNQGLTQTKDQLSNNALALQQQIAQFQAAQSQKTAANTKQYDPTSVLQDLASYHVGLINNGATPQQAQQATLFAAGNTYGQNNLSGIQQALYGDQKTSPITSFVNAKLNPAASSGSYF